MTIRKWSRTWLRRLRTLIRRDVVERELDEELAFATVSQSPVAWRVPGRG